MENVKEEKKVHPFSKEAREQRKKEAESKEEKKELMEKEEPKSLEEQYGLPKIDPDKVYQFEYLIKPISKSAWVAGMGKIYDPVEKRQRIIRYVPHEESIFEDEQAPPLDGEKKHYEVIYFPEGKKNVSGKDKNLVMFLMLTDDNVARPHRLNKLPAVFKLVDKEADARKSMEVDSLFRKALAVIQDSPLEEILPFAAISGVDITNYKEREAQIRIGVTRKAKSNPTVFLRAFKDPKYARKFTLYKAFTENLITANHIKHAVVWKDSLVKITDVPPGESALDYLTDWSFSKDGEAFFSTLSRLVE